MSIRRARRDQALDETCLLSRELQDWYAECTARDKHGDGTPRGQYKSQLDAVTAEVKAAAEILGEDLRNMDLGGSISDVYDKCGRTERETIWLWRVWLFFRDKFDQRLDPRFHGTLKAADEVVWSCYSAFFGNHGAKHLGGPPPLPYVEADHSPVAYRKYERNALHRKGRDFRLVKKAFETLPIPLLKIPITAVQNPWATVLIGHETGHYVQPVIQPKFGYTASFAREIREAVKEAGGDEEDQGAWQLWGDEIFADWYSVLMMGQWAVWAMAQFEIADPDWMRTRRVTYPSPVVRLAMLAALAEHYGLAGNAILTELGVDLTSITGDGSEAARDLSFVAPVVGAVTASLPADFGSLSDFVGFSRPRYLNGGNGAPLGEVQQWSNLISSGGARPPSMKLHSARMVAAGTAHVWSNEVFGGADPGEDRLEELRDRARESMIEAAEPGSRSSHVVGARPNQEPGRALVELLGRADDDEFLEDG